MISDDPTRIADLDHPGEIRPLGLSGFGEIERRDEDRDGARINAGANRIGVSCPSTPTDIFVVAVGTIQLEVIVIPNGDSKCWVGGRIIGVRITLDAVDGHTYRRGPEKQR